MTVDECIHCHGWGPVRPKGVCAACLNWKTRGGIEGRCLRCGHHGPRSRHRLCRACTHQVLREPDEDWLLARRAGVPGPIRDLQLALRLPGLTLGRAVAVTPDPLPGLPQRPGRIPGQLRLQGPPGPAVAPSGQDIGECGNCHGWGPIRSRGLCPACFTYKPKDGGHGACRRCRHDHGTTNRDGVCRPCAVAIRIDPDLDWAEAALLDRPGPVRDLQLVLQLPEIALPTAFPLRRRDDIHPRVRSRVDTWIRTRPKAVDIRDDPRVLPSQIPGQLPLFPRMRERLTIQHARRIRDRPTAQLDQALAALDRVAARRTELSTCWRRAVVEILPLALATRQPGERLVDEYDIPELPGFRPAVAEVLKEAGLLRVRLGFAPARNGYQRERRRLLSCEHCLAWSGNAKPLCDTCREWGKHPSRTLAPCDRCHRTWPLKNGRCRFCHLVLHEHRGDGPVIEQLWFGAGITPGLSANQPGAYNRDLGRRRALRRRERDDARAALQPSPHLLDPRQPELFPTPERAWHKIVNLQPPALTTSATQLLEEFRKMATEQHWPHQTYDVNLRSLRMLVGWLGAEAPLLESDLQQLARLGPNWAGRRVAAFLAERDMLVPAQRTDSEQAAVERLLATLPTPLRDEVNAWVRAMRGEGRRPSPTRDWATIRHYGYIIVPVVQKWSQQITSLREITTEDIENVLRDEKPSVTNARFSGLRSLFRGLKRERVIFRDPARMLKNPRAIAQPRRIPSDRLAGIVDQAPTSLMKAVIALIAIHAVGTNDLRHQKLRDLDRSTGRLTIRRPHGNRVVILDEFTTMLLTTWLHERAQRWPTSTNPHLFVSQISALDPAGPPIGKLTLHKSFIRLGVQPQELRVDRILDEAHHTADPIHLMRVFGISTATAVKYTRAAHPEKFGQDPTQA